NALKRIVAQFLDRDCLAAKTELFARRTGRSEQSQPGHGKVASLQRLDHLDADSTCRADHSHMRIPVHKLGAHYSRWPGQVKLAHRADEARGARQNPSGTPKRRCFDSSFPSLPSVGFPGL